MKALLICPGPRPGVAALTEATPLGLATCLGKNLVEHWLAHLVTRGARHVQVLASDRPAQVRQQIGDGSRWGLRVEVAPTTHELTVEEARTRYRPTGAPGWLAAPEDVIVVDRLPGRPERSLATDYADWFAGVVDWMPHAATPDRIGVRQIQPGVWCGLQTRVSPHAQLRPPCWLGESVWVGPGAVVGPETVIENGVFVDARAEITRSAVGPETYVGQLAQVRDSLVCGNTLINWQTGWCSAVSDAFLLAPLNSKRRAPRGPRLWSRMAAVAALGLTAPVAMLAIGSAVLRRQPVFTRRLAVRPRTAGRRPDDRPLVYFELQAARGGWRRWPQLWNIARGQFAWVGNRPLEPAQAAGLANDFERLWLAAPIGLVSLADANGCAEEFGDEARAHASFYAVSARPTLDRSILCRAAWARLRRRRWRSSAREDSPPLGSLAEEQS